MPGVYQGYAGLYQGQEWVQGGAYLGGGPVVAHGDEFPAVGRAEVHPPGAPEEGGVLLAHQPHGGRVDDGGHLLDVVNQNLRSTVQDSTVKNNGVQYCTVRYRTGQDGGGVDDGAHSTVQCDAVQYRTICMDGLFFRCATCRPLLFIIAVQCVIV